MSCPFCTKEDIKQRTIHENELAFAFPTHQPIVPGHILVVPKRCIAKYDDLTSQEHAAIEKLRTKLTQALKKTVSAQGFNYAWNENLIAGQTVPHFHLHIVPRKENDQGIYEYEPRKFLYRPGSRAQSPQEELVDIATELKNKLENL